MNIKVLSVTIIDGECGYVLSLCLHDSSLSASSKDALLSTECPSQTEVGYGHHTADTDNTFTTLRERDRHSKWRCGSTEDHNLAVRKKKERTFIASRTEQDQQQIVRLLMNNIKHECQLITGILIPVFLFAVILHLYFINYNQSDSYT